MKRSAIVFLGLTVGFAVLAKVSDWGTWKDRVAVVESAETEPTESVVDWDSREWRLVEDTGPRSPLQDFPFAECIAADDQDAFLESWFRESKQREEERLEEQFKLRYPYSQWDSPFPSWGGAIIRNFSYDENGNMTERLQWGARNLAFPIDW